MLNLHGNCVENTPSAKKLYATCKSSFGMHTVISQAITYRFFLLNLYKSTILLKYILDVKAHMFMQL